MAFTMDFGASPDEIRKKQMIADALMGNAWTARTPGQAIAQAAERIAGALLGRQADKAGKEGRAGANERWERANPTFPTAPAAPAGSSVSSEPDYASSRVAQAFGDEGSGPDYRSAIASIESGGKYDAVGPTHAKMGRALGKYQIMESNVGPWSKEALGREVSADEFLANPQIQDAVFDHKFKGYVNAYGPEGAAQAWLGGPGGVGKTGRKDSLGTSIGEYGQRFMGKLGQPSGGVQKIAQALTGQAPEMAGNVMSDASGPSMDQLMQLAGDEWQPESRQGIVQALMGQRMKQQEAQYEQQMKQADPAYKLGLEKSQFELDQSRRKRNLVETKDGIYDADTGEWITNPNARADSAETGLNPQLMRDKDGNLFYGQPTKDGRILRSAVEDGSVPVGPGDKAYETTVGKASGEAAAGIPAAQGVADQVTLQIDELMSDPYLNSMLGSIEGRLPNVSSDAARVQGKMDQLQGGAFLQARQLLKGGGQITDFEGKKAEAAMARLYTAQNEQDYRAALQDFKDAVQVGLAKLQQTSQIGRPQMTGGRVPAANYKDKYGLD